MKKHIPWCTLSLALVSVCLTAWVAIRPALFETLAMWSQPDHVWQYLSGIFIHGLEPKGFWAIHLGLNLMGLLPLGILAENAYGTKKCAALFAAEWLVTALLFQLMHLGKHTFAVGISSIVYAFAAAALPVVLKRLRASSRPLRRQPLMYYAAFEYLGLVSMLNPRNGVSALALHASGLLTGGVFLLLRRRNHQKGARPHAL